MREVPKKKLAERLRNLHASFIQLFGYKDRYKIKLMGPDYRLVHEVPDKVLTAVSSRWKALT